ncbi:RecX family transcriptional regulator [Deferribacterales bacterium Es71-Z0220]|jgi:regulatory protein|uniref:regulatory protein RecX n=1 Tax=Deferrivibrio essentukiensis TaxID=2880922 RepID=UPI001F6097B2|nr:RecX family transcriptional regulator [Deferrivibrio essentukiensis]MBZ4672445.1 recombination regulator RecX [Deferribacteraceae bacterium]MCB4205408.1 RecX family transcriptional regulator [Deferrivibrio essentukiensis]
MTTHQKVCSYLYKLLSHKDYSEKELVDKISKKFDLPRGQLDDILSDFRAKGFVNDERLAKNIISYKLDLLYGPAKISEILFLKGLQNYQNYIYEYFDEKVEAIIPVLKEKLSKKYIILSRKKDLKVYEKLLRYLIGRGYEYNFSKKIVMEVMKDEGNFS